MVEKYFKLKNKSMLYLIILILSLSNVFASSCSQTKITIFSAFGLLELFTIVGAGFLLITLSKGDSSLGTVMITVIGFIAVTIVLLTGYVIIDEVGQSTCQPDPVVLPYAPLLSIYDRVYPTDSTTLDTMLSSVQWSYSRSAFLQELNNNQSLFTDEWVTYLYNNNMFGTGARYLNGNSDEDQYGTYIHPFYLVSQDNINVDYTERRFYIPVVVGYDTSVYSGYELYNGGVATKGQTVLLSGILTQQQLNAINASVGGPPPPPPPPPP